MGLERQLQQLAESVINGKHLRAEGITRELLSGGCSPGEILSQGLMPGMEHVGTEFRAGRYFLPQVLVAARAMKKSMEILEPLLSAASFKTNGRILLGTVKGDVHDIGKNLVAILLRGAGYSVVDLGVGCSAEMFLDGYKKHEPDIVGLSALLTTTMIHMKTVVDLFRKHGIMVPIVIGGAPVSSRFAEEIGATAYARNASEAVNLVKSILAGRI